MELDHTSYKVRGREIKTFDVAGTVTIDQAATWNASTVANATYLQSDGTTVGANTQVSLIPSVTGAGYGQSVGMKYLLHKLSVRGSIRSTSIALTAANYVRLALVLDKQPNLAAPAGQGVFTDWGTSEQLMFSFPSEASGTGGRYEILKDLLVRQDPAGFISTTYLFEGSEFQFNWIPKKPLEVFLKEGGTTPNVANLANRNVFLIVHSSLNNIVSMNYCSRAEYSDRESF